MLGAGGWVLGRLFFDRGFLPISILARMKAAATLDRLHREVRANVWLHYFTYFVRFALALGFIPAGVIKILGYRFADGLSVVHPMGHYLEALAFTGFYYTFIGVAQVLAGALLLVPRLATLGALLYLPIILNICILSFAVRFDGSLLTAPLMVAANVYLLAWDYDKLKSLFSLKPSAVPKPYIKRFPWKYFLSFGAIGMTIFAGFIVMTNLAIMPRNSLSGCQNQFADSANEAVGEAFCDCVHMQGLSLRTCLSRYEELLLTHTSTADEPLEVPGN